MKQEELERLAQSLGGMCILGCLEGSPAHLAGLKYGDVLLEVNGRPTPNLGAFVEATRQWASPMRIRVFRRGREERLEFELPPRPAKVDATGLLQRVMRSGVLPASVTPPDDDPQLLS